MDPDLARVIATWPTLSPAVRAVVLAILDTHERPAAS
jgi:hypothetical protein